jgi:DNA-binding PucR family transcriptional regulator
MLDAAVAHMHADDLESGTDNVLTAKTYIETGFNLNATAQAISVHRNTMAYRLKQIHDRYGIDLSVPVADHDLVFRVLLSCKILLGDS